MKLVYAEPRGDLKEEIAEDLKGLKAYLSFLEKKENLTEVFDYKVYLEFMKNRNDIDSIPPSIQEHFDFINKVFDDLKLKHPKDIYLRSLKDDENMKNIFLSYNWYSLYGVEK